MTQAQRRVHGGFGGRRGRTPTDAEMAAQRRQELDRRDIERIIARAGGMIFQRVALGPTDAELRASGKKLPATDAHGRRTAGEGFDPHVYRANTRSEAFAFRTSLAG